MYFWHKSMPPIYCDSLAKPASRCLEWRLQKNWTLKAALQKLPHICILITYHTLTYYKFFSHSAKSILNDLCPKKHEHDFFFRSESTIIF